MNKKGQALVEFVIILPIFLLLILGVVDIGTVLYNRTMLEGSMTDVISMYERGLDESEIKRDLTLEYVDISIEDTGEEITFYLSKDIDIITPGLNLIFDNPYHLQVIRSIPHE